ncbi:MAG: hypothetical protein ABEH38_08700 [Flavobacteriales bacterium]
MAKEAFEQRLREFFETYDERKLKLVPKIAKKLHKHEELIINHLHHKYNTGKARNVSEEELREEDRIRRKKESGSGGEDQAEASKEQSEGNEEEEVQAEDEKSEDQEADEEEEEKKD